LRILRQGVRRLDETSAYACLRLMVPAVATIEDLGTALEFLTERVAAQEEAQRLCARLGHRAVELGLLEEADRIVEALTERCPQLASAHAERGLLLERRGNREAAIEALRRAWALDGAVWETACRLGRLLVDGGGAEELEQGVELLKRAAELAGADPRAQFE